MRSWAVIFLLGWGVLSLGASRPWGYLPLIAGMTTYGSVSFVVRRSPDPIGRALTLALASMSVAVAAQLIPLPAEVVRVISPGVTHVMGEVPARSGGDISLPLSVHPRATLLALTFVTALSLFFIGVVRMFGRGEASKVAAGLVVLGGIVACIGIAEQRTSWSGVYGMLRLPLPPDSSPLGPFASRNHYAGWVLMAFAITMGYLCAIVDGSLTPARVGRPHRVAMRIARTVWAVTVAGTVSAMALAIIQTGSRAGILGLVVALTVIGGRLLHRVASTKARILVATALLLLPVLGVAMAGMQLIVNRFVSHSWSTAHGRLPIWRQAVGIVRDFPLTGSGLNTYQHAVRFYPVADLDKPYEGAHNDFLQLATEGGLLVGIPVLSIAACFVRQATQRFHDSCDDDATRWIRLGAVTGLLLMVGQEMVEFSLQVPGNAALFAVLAAIAVHRNETDVYA
jgi:O-antigen ligase